MAEVTAAQSPTFRFGKTALWLHALGLASLLLAITIFTLMSKASEEAYAILGVGGAAWLAVSAWSLVLSWRSRKNGEPPRLRVLLFMLVLIEASVSLLLFWIFDYRRWQILGFYDTVRWLIDCAFGLCLPVLLPFFSVLLCAGLLLSEYWAKRVTEGDLRQRKRRWLFRIIVIPAILLLPWLLFFYSVSTLSNGGSSRLGAAYFHHAPGDIRKAIAEGTPNFIRDTVETGLAQFQWNSAVNMRLTMLGCGLVSRARLLKSLDDSSVEVMEWACYALQKNFPTEALPKLLAFGDARLPASPSRDRRATAAGELVGKACDLAEIRPILDQRDALNVNFRWQVLRGILHHRNAPLANYIGDVIYLWAQDLMYMRLTGDLKLDSMDKSLIASEWLKLFKHRELSFREELVQIIMYLNLTDKEVWRESTGDPDVVVRRRAVAIICVYRVPERIQLLAKSLDDQDLAVRRMAVFALAAELGIPIRMTPNERMTILLRNQSTAFVPKAPIVGEDKELEMVRAAAQKMKW